MPRRDASPKDLLQVLKGSRKTKQELGVLHVTPAFLQPPSSPPCYVIQVPGIGAQGLGLRVETLLVKGMKIPANPKGPKP